MAVENNFLLFWLDFFPCFINIEIVALVPVLCVQETANSYYKGSFDTVWFLHDSYRVELPHREMPVVITGTGLAVKALLLCQCLYCLGYTTFGENFQN